jgi:iron-sulfur cluster assembly accessory protein
LTFNCDMDTFAALLREDEFPFDPRIFIDAGLRIAVIGGGCSGFQYQMTLDKDPQEDDKVFDMDGLKVFVDMKSFLYLNGSTVAYVEGPEESGFTFDNPNANESCGCGETFEA